MPSPQQWLDYFTIDPNISLEGGVAAVALLAAAIGYIANLIGNLRRRREDTSILGDKFVLLELLKAEPLRGFSEDQLLAQYRDPEAKPLVDRFKATRQTKMTEDTIERRLRELQWEHMVEPTVRNTYVLRTGFSKASEEADLARSRKEAHLLRKVSPTLVFAALKREADAAEGWRKDRVIEGYAALGTAAALDELVGHLSSDDPAIAGAAAAEVAKFLRHVDLEAPRASHEPTNPIPAATRSPSHEHNGREISNGATPASKETD